MARAARTVGAGSSEGREPGADEATLLAGDAFDRAALALAEASAGVGVWSIDLTTNRVRGTAQFFRIMGLPPTTDSIPVETVRALRHPDDRDRVVAGFREALEHGNDSYEIEYRIIRPDGNERWIFGRGRVIRDGDGHPIRYSGVDLDITDRKATEAALHAARRELERMNSVLEQRVRERTAELEAEAARRAAAESHLHQAQKMEAVGQLTGGIAHDFNNILQVIMGNLEIIRMALEREEASAERVADHRALAVRAAGTAQRAAHSAKQLVSRLLAFSRQQPLAPTVHDINALVSDMIEMIQRVLGATIRVQTSLTPGTCLVYADRNMLESMLLNLVVNARDAMPDGGELTLETANADFRAHAPHGLTPGQYVMLCVSDSGCGIATEHLDRVFEPFFTTKDTGKGSGLGLSMVYGFVKQSGGHIHLYSEVGKGTAVKIYLPSSSPEGAASHAGGAAESPTALPSAIPGETIMLVEDDEEVRRFGVSALESLGYRVLEAPDGLAALRVFNAPDAPRIDLLLTDVVLPNGMSGRDLAAAVRVSWPRLPTLFTSGYTRNAMPKDGRLESESRLLNKPYSIHALAVSCRRALDAAVGDTTH